MLNLTTLLVTGDTVSSKMKKALFDAGILLVTGILSAMAVVGYPPTVDSLYVPIIAACVAALATFKAESIDENKTADPVATTPTVPPK